MSSTREIAHPDLLAEIEAFLAGSGMSRSRFGQEAVGDPRFVPDLKAGRQCLPKTVNKVRGWIADQSGQRGAA